MSDDKKKESGDSKKDDVKSKLGDLTKDEPKKEAKKEEKKEAKKEEKKVEKKAAPPVKADETFQAATKLNALMEKRNSRLEKTFKINILVGLVVVCFIIVYMNWVYSEFKDNMKPGVLADVVTAEVTTRIPTFSRELETKLKKEAPGIVAAIKNTVINESIPALRKAIQDELTKFLDEFFRTAPDVFNEEIYLALLTANKDRITAALAKDFSDAKVAGAFEKELEKALAANLAKNPTETLSKKLDKTVSALTNINKGLKRLSKGGKLSKGETLMKQLISSWWTMFEGTDKLTKRDIKGANEVGKKVADELFGDHKKEEPKKGADPAKAPAPKAPPAK